MAEVAPGLEYQSWKSSVPSGPGMFEGIGDALKGAGAAYLAQKSGLVDYLNPKQAMVPPGANMGTATGADMDAFYSPAGAVPPGQQAPTMAAPPTSFGGALTNAANNYFAKQNTHINDAINALGWNKPTGGQ